MLFLAVVLAGGYGPLTAQPAPDTLATQSSRTDAGSGGHRSAPVISKQQLALSEARDAKCAPSDDGKAKAFLASGSAALPLPSLASADAACSDAGAPAFPASSFDARAPPILS